MTDPIPPRPDGLYPALPEPPLAPERPAATWRWWEAILVYVVIAIFFGALVALPLLRLIRSKGLAELTTSAAIAAANVGLLVLWLHRFHPMWRRIIGLPRRVWPEVRAGIGFGLLLYPGIVFGVGIIVTALLEALAVEDVSAPRQIPAHLSAVGVAVSIGYAVVIAPIHEELFFRGILFRSLRDRYGFGIGAVGSGAAFGLIHYVPGAWYSTVLLISVMVVTGFALAYLYERRGNIVAIVVAHATFNVIGLSFIFALR